MRVRLKYYRVVRDRYSGYEAQVWRAWWPFWRQIGFTNTHSSIEGAVAFIEKWKVSGDAVWRSWE